MASQSPPKPWERVGSGATSAALASPSTVATAPGNSVTSSSSTAPALPDRPSSLSSVVNQTASAYSNPNSPYANRAYGASPYGLGSSPLGSMYSSPYSRFGGGSMYGGGGMYGGVGGMYGGGYGSMYGTGAGMYGPGRGMPGDPNDPNNSLTNNFQQSTQATFQIIESIVGAFGGFAQMLESTYMATHSSFFAMVSVAEQFGNLRTTLGSVLGIYTLMRWFRTLMAKITGRPPPADATSLTPSAFAAFTGTAPPNIPPGQPGHVPPRPSKKPFIVFLVAVFGLPYLMGKLISALARNQEQQMQQQQQQQQLGPNGQPLALQDANSRRIDVNNLDFCKVLYDFPPADAVSNGSFNSDLDLRVNKGDLVAVLDKSNPDTQVNPSTQSDWWRCRARDGRIGYLPAVYLETIQKRPVPAQITATAANPGETLPVPQLESRAQTMSAASAGSRAQTMLSSSTAPEGRAHTMSSATSLGSARTSSLRTGTQPLAKGVAPVPTADASVAGFQKSGFYNP